MSDLSYAATLAWQIGAAEAGAARAPFLEPRHLLIGICSLEKLPAAPPAQLDLPPEARAERARGCQEGP
jgi:hypothetical protein